MKESARYEIPISLTLIYYFSVYKLLMFVYTKIERSKYHAKNRYYWCW